MLVAIYMIGLDETPLARHITRIDDVCSLIKDIGETRIEKVVILDFHDDHRTEDISKDCIHI